MTDFFLPNDVPPTASHTANEPMACATAEKAWYSYHTATDDAANVEEEAMGWPRSRLRWRGWGERSAVSSSAFERRLTGSESNEELGYSLHHRNRVHNC